MLIKDKNIEMVFIAETEGNINEISIDKCQIKNNRITYYIVITK